MVALDVVVIVAIGAVLVAAVATLGWLLDGRTKRRIAQGARYETESHDASTDTNTNYNIISHQATSMRNQSSSPYS